MQETVDRWYFQNKKEPAMFQTHSARETSYLKVENETFKT